MVFIDGGLFSFREAHPAKVLRRTRLLSAGFAFELNRRVRDPKLFQHAGGFGEDYPLAATTRSEQTWTMSLFLPLVSAQTYAVVPEAHDGSAFLGAHFSTPSDGVSKEGPDDRIFGSAPKGCQEVDVVTIGGKCAGSG